MLTEKGFLEESPMAEAEPVVHDEEQALTTFENLLEGVWKHMAEQRQEGERNWREFGAVGDAKCIASIDEELPLSLSL